MKSRAAIAWEAGKPLEVIMVDLEGPKTGEVLIRCHRSLSHRCIHAFRRRSGRHFSFHPWTRRRSSC